MSKSGSSGAFGSPLPKTEVPTTSFGIPPKKSGSSTNKQNYSPFGTSTKKSAPGKQPASPFGTTPSVGAFGSPAPKVSGAPNVFGSPPKKSVVATTEQASSPFGKSTKQSGTAPGKQSASLYDNAILKSGSSSPFKSPSTNQTGEPVKQASSSTKKPFSPFSQGKQVSPDQSKPSFSSRGPVYMPPASKANNAGSLNDIYSTLDGKQQKSSKDGQGTGIGELKEMDTAKTSESKKSYSPFGGTKPVSNSMFRDSQPTRSGFPSSTTPGIPTDVNPPIVSGRTSSVPPSSPEEQSKKSFSPYGTKLPLATKNTNPVDTASGSSLSSTSTISNGQEVKKSFSPYGRKPKQSADNAPKTDPSSFSFGAPSSTPPNQGNSQGYGTTSAPKPFAATGFPPKGNSISPNEEENGTMQRDRLNDLEIARKRAMDQVRDEQKE